jgi:CBS domain-containing protein
VRLRDVVAPGHVVVPLDAPTVAQAAWRLAERLVDQGAVSDPGRLRAALRAARLEDVVAVGEHAFLPHVRTDAVDRLLAAIGIAPAPIAWEKDPQRAARIVIFVVAPPHDAGRYLQVVSAFARVLSDQDTVQAMLAARTPEAVLAAGALGSVDLPGQLTVRDVMTAQAVTVSPDDRLGDVARTMVERDIRAVPVVDESGALVGIVTHRELLRHLLPSFVQRATTGSFRAPTRTEIARRAVSDPRDLPVRDVMSRSVLSVSEDQTLSDVATLMNSKDVDRFPVTREGAVVGFLTRADLVRKLVTF